MKVLCINDKGWKVRRRFLFFRWFIKKGVPGPKYMEECTVTDELVNEFGPAYRLAEYGSDKYPQIAFVYLSDIDGVEVLKKKEDKYA